LELLGHECGQLVAVLFQVIEDCRHGLLHGLKGLMPTGERLLPEELPQPLLSQGANGPLTLTPLEDPKLRVPQVFLVE